MRKVLSAVAVVAVLGLAGCGGGEEAGESQRSPEMRAQPDGQEVVDTTRADSMMARDTAGMEVPR